MGGNFIANRKKKSTRRWNRTHYFQNEKKPTGTKGEYKEHPVLIFGKSGDYVKPIVFTHSSTTKGISNVKLKHNVDPDDVSDCYAVPYRGVHKASDFKPPKKNYRIHPEDARIVKQLKSINKKK